MRMIYILISKGEEGIRTLGMAINHTTDQQSTAFNHSATSPYIIKFYTEYIANKTSSSGGI